MNMNKIILITFSAFILYSCAEYKVKKDEKIYYSSSGFALVYDDNLYSDKIITKRIKNDDFQTMHNFLKTNTTIKIINPENDKFIDVKINKKAEYPKIFNIVISKKIASFLELDLDNPYIEVLETKKNKIFVAKKTTTYEEEKNVAETVPIDKIEIDNLSENETDSELKRKKNLKKFTLVIGDFYYKDSALNLMNELRKKTNMNNINVKKINKTKYRLMVGPFKSFNALKIAYISLNNLGFENLNIYNN